MSTAVVWRFALVAMAVPMVLSSGVGWAAAQPGDSVVRTWRLTPEGQSAQRPRFSPDGRRLVFHSGGDHSDIFLIDVDGANLLRLTTAPADDRDPAWSRNGARIVFSSNRGGDYDLWSVAADGSDVQLLLALEGDELEPAISPLTYTFSAVISDGCAPHGAAGERLDTYEKVAFTRRQQDVQAVWFASLNEVGGGSGTHVGRISAEGAECGAPAWSGNGLSLTWQCAPAGGTHILDTHAQWDQTFAAALASLWSEDEDRHEYEDEEEGCLDSDPRRWQSDACLQALPRHYARYEAETISEVGERRAEPTYSTNQILVIAGNEGTTGDVMVRQRGPEAAWRPFEVGMSAHRPVWSPAGSLVAFDSAGEGTPAVYLSEVDFYLQDVGDLVDYPELYGAGTSTLLHGNRFVARHSEGKELFEAYEQLRYEHRAQFVTADAALQVFHDEFTALLRSAEVRAQGDLTTLSAALAEYFTDRFTATGEASHRYLAIYFHVPNLMLQAANQSRPPSELTADDPWLLRECRRHAEGQEEWGPEQLEQCQAVLHPTSVIDQIAQAVPARVAELPESIRAEVESHVTAALAHAELGEIRLPDGREVPVDWTQFQVRGHYAESELAGYFLAMMWFGLIPMPLDATVMDLFAALEAPDGGSVDGEPTNLGDLWEGIDRLMGAFMGRPVDASLAHLREIAHDQPHLLAPFDRPAVQARLAELRGPVRVHGLAGALEGAPYPLQLTFFPRRLGLDVEVFAELTHPGVPTRGFPSALDLMAAVGAPRARVHAEAQEAGQPYYEAYRTALQVAVERVDGLGEAYFATDIYHSWLATLAALAALATPTGIEVPLPFTESDAWSDRILLSALAGYTQLKHSAVLYAYQDYGVECDSDRSVMVFIEQPVIPEPRGFVDPVPAFFEHLAALAGRVHTELARGEAPTVDDWYGALGEGDREIALNARVFAERLADLARREIAGEPLTSEDYVWIRGVGAHMEGMFLGAAATEDFVFSGDEGRLRRGVAIATDVHSNVTSNEVLQLAIGRLMDLYVAVPDGVGSRMTQGALLSFYEFRQPMSARLTDDAWLELLNSEAAPSMPSWTRSFVEPAPTAP